MKIWLVACETIPGVDPGARAFRVSMLADALVDSGHDVTWFTSDFDHYSKTRRPATPAVTQSGVPLRFLHAPPYRRHVGVARVRHHRALARAFLRATADPAMPPPDMVFVCLPPLELAEVACGFGRDHGSLVVVDVRDPWPDVYLGVLPRHLRSMGRAVLAPEYARARRTLAGADAVVAVSEEYLRWGLALAGREQSRFDGVFHIGYPWLPPLDPAASSAFRRRYGIGDSELLVACTGSFSRSWDADCVGQAAAICRRSGTGVRFVVAGEWPETVRRRCERHGGGVIFTGWLDRDDMAVLLGAADAGALTYVEGHLVAMPNKIFESFAAGLPVLSSFGGEVRRLLAETGAGASYSAGDSAALADAAMGLARDRPALDAMSEAAKSLWASRGDPSVVYAGLGRHLELLVDKVRP